MSVEVDDLYPFDPCRSCTLGSALSDTHSESSAATNGVAKVMINVHFELSRGVSSIRTLELTISLHLGMS